MTIAFAVSSARPRSSSVMLLRVGTLEGCWGPPPVPARGEGSRLTVGVGVGVAAAVVDAAVVLSVALGVAVTSVRVGVRPAVVVAGAGVVELGVGVLVAVEVPLVMRVPPGAELSVLAEQPVASSARAAAVAVILRVMERGFL